MSNFFKRLSRPSSTQDIYLRPFLMMAFTLLMLIVAMLVNAQKEVALKMPDSMNFNVAGTSKITFDPDQYAELLTVMERFLERQPVVIENKLAAPAPGVVKKVNKKRKKRWHPTRPAGYY